MRHGLRQLFFFFASAHPSSQPKRQIDRITRFWAAVCKTVHPICYRTVVCLSVCDVGLLWTKSWMDQDETLHGGRPLPGHIVLDGDLQFPLPEGAHSPQFSAHVYCGHTARWIKMPLATEIGLGPGDIVKDGFPAPPQKGAEPPPQFSTRGQRAGCIRMPLLRSLGSGDIVLDGDPAPHKRGIAIAPNFRPMSIVAKRLDGSCQFTQPMSNFGIG